MRPARAACADVPEHGAGDHLYARAQRMQVDVVGSFSEEAEVSLRLPGARRREARCGRSRRRCRFQRGCCAECERRNVAAFGEGRARLRPGGGRTARRGFAAGAAGDPRADGAVDMWLDDGVDGGGATEVGIGVGVAEGVAQRREATERRRAADANDFAVLRGDHRRAGLGVDHRPGKRLRSAAAIGCDSRKAVAEVRCGVNREARLGEPGDRAEQF